MAADMTALTLLGGGFRVRNGILRARIAKRMQAKNTTVTHSASAIFALIA